MRILLVEDNEDLGGGLKKLFDGTYAIDHVLTGETALLAARTVVYDLVVLDLSLPDIDGLEVLREMRSQRLSMPVLVLTARDKLGDRVAGLDLGADDYMTKPFELSELEARIRALLRRASLEKTSFLQMGHVGFDLRNNSVTASGATLEISSRETMVLRALMLAHGRLLSKAHLLEATTDFNDDISENAVEQYVSRLRKKLLPHGLTINAARGLGYHLREVE